ncbi:helix-turn-helix domain-containing protein [Shimia sp. SDUM112013]|uniref:TetR/AcrR family transcriptional regulator n=1 Tax=Shimia sp. SDUM112013 TaxID=3136160 RepID=UPI0032EE3481
MTRRKIKTAAMKLFAEKGLEAVSVRDINKAAGQRNAGSINYHFSSRDDLIREIMMDVGKILDDDHSARLDRIEATGGPRSIRDVADVLVSPSLTAAVDQQENRHSLRFLQMAVMSHRDMLMEAMDNSPGLNRCLDHLRRMAPEMPEDLLDHRIRLGMKFLLITGSAREQALQDGDNSDPYWQEQWAPGNVEDAFVGIITAPVSPQTQTLFDQRDDTQDLAS